MIATDPHAAIALQHNSSYRPDIQNVVTSQKDSLFLGLELGHGSWLEGGHWALFSEQTGILSPMPENIWARGLNACFISYFKLLFSSDERSSTSLTALSADAEHCCTLQTAADEIMGSYQ